MNALLKNIDDNTAIVFLPNPNVPIEGTLSLGEIASLAEYCKKKNACLAIDEVYHGFGATSALGLIKEFDNILLCGRFRKLLVWRGCESDICSGPQRI